ncbi:MAG: histidine kinase [Bacteroidota bacterium]
MKRLFTSLLFIGYCTLLSCQHLAQIDSLKRLIPQKEDTALIHLYEELERLYFQYHLSTDSVEKYFQLSMELAEDIDYEEVIKEFSYRQSLLFYRKGEYNRAVESVRMYILERQQKRDAEGMVKGKSTLGSFYNRQTKYQEAVAILLEAIELSDEIKDKKELYLIYNRLASIFQEMDDFEQSTEYYNLAKSHIQYIPKAYLPTSEITLLYNIATNFYNQDQLDSARYYTNLVLEKAQKINYEEGIHQGLFMQMYIATEAEEDELVLRFANELIAFYGEGKSRNLEWHLTALRSKAIALANLKRHQEAMEVSTQMEVLAAHCELLICEERVKEVKYLISRERGDYEQSIAFAEDYYEFKDSMLNAEKEKYIQELQERYETTQKEKTIIELDQQNQEQSFRLQKRNYLIAAISLSALLLLLSLYWFFQQKIAKEAQQKIEAEQRLLRVQMNPHFIFNSLANIQSFLLEEKDSQKGILYLSQFATLMRQILEHSREQYISVEEEIQMLENYLALQKARHQDRFSYQIKVDEKIEIWDTLIPPLMTQPFVENAIQHSRIQDLEDGYISLVFKKETDRVVVIVEDNGIGRKKTLNIKTENAHKSLSSSITKERIQLLGKITKKSFKFEIKDLFPQGTQVVLEFPLTMP